jgi:hypothetical protein
MGLIMVVTPCGLVYLRPGMDTPVHPSTNPPSKRQSVKLALPMLLPEPPPPELYRPPSKLPTTDPKLEIALLAALLAAVTEDLKFSPDPSTLAFSPRLAAVVVEALVVAAAVSMDAFWLEALRVTAAP